MTTSKVELEKALEISHRMNDGINSIISWCQSVNNELDQVESTPKGDRDVEVELTFVKVGLTFHFSHYQ